MNSPGLSIASSAESLTDFGSNTPSLKRDYDECSQDQDLPTPSSFIYSCPHCPKKYSFQVSLISHTKFRHPECLPTLKRGRPKKNKRGRPRKNPTEKPTETNGFLLDFSDVASKLYNTTDIHPLYNKLKELAQLQPLIQNKTCDYILAEYIYHLRYTLSREKSKVGIKFVLLYRDCFNRISREQSDYANGETLPNTANEFMAKLPHQHLSKNEAKEHTFNMCQWLFNSSYTYITLTILDKDKFN